MIIIMQWIISNSSSSLIFFVSTCYFPLLFILFFIQKYNSNQLFKTHSNYSNKTTLFLDETKKKTSHLKSP